jgi:hypothetical protein
MQRLGWLALIPLTLAACDPAAVLPTSPTEPERPSASSPGPRPAPSPTPTPTTPPAAGAPATRASYDPARDGFVVHEWGTFTSVMGSDGALLPGLHHEEEDLPPFVADRMKQALADPSNPGLTAKAVTATAKLETPVTYFYSPRSLKVSVSARFPQGFFSQWFPYVTRMLPPVMDVAPSAAASANLVDRWMQSPEEIPVQCRARYAGEMANGLLDWGTVDVLAPDSSPVLLQAPPAMTWGFARNTAANAVEVRAPGAGLQREKFLFYRGLGRLELPLVALGKGAGRLRLENRDAGQALGGLVAMTVTRQAAGFRAVGEVPAGGALDVQVPEPTLALPEFVDALKRLLVERLVADGLYADEAQAMVDTWERAYFLTPGTRVLYLLPQATTDRVLPLSLEPRPAILKRTVVVRVEALPLEFENELAAGARGLMAEVPAEAAAARAFFLSHGRFAEPYLARALALVPAAGSTPPAAALLAEVRARRRWAPAWSE